MKIKVIFNVPSWTNKDGFRRLLNKALHNIEVEEIEVIEGEEQEASDTKIFKVPSWLK